MKRDRKKRVKSRRPVATSALKYDEGFKQAFEEREKREEEVMVCAMYDEESEAIIKEEVSKMEKELKSQRNLLANLSKKRSKRDKISKKEVEAKDEDDEFKVAVLDVGMATVKVL